MASQVFLPGTIAGAASCPAEDKAILDPQNSPNMTNGVFFVLQVPYQRQLKDAKPTSRSVGPPKHVVPDQ